MESEQHCMPTLLCLQRTYVRTYVPHNLLKLLSTYMCMHRLSLTLAMYVHKIERSCSAYMSYMYELNFCYRDRVPGNRTTFSNTMIYSKMSSQTTANKNKEQSEKRKNTNVLICTVLLKPLRTSMHYPCTECAWARNQLSMHQKCTVMSVLFRHETCTPEICPKFT